MTRPYVSATARLLDREIPDDYLTEWTDIVAAKPQDIELRTASAVIFRIGSEWLALPTGAFQEIAELSGIHSLPHSSHSVLNGLVNVRGELLLCAALDVLLGFEKKTVAAQKRQHAAEGRLLVCNYKGDRVVFAANEVAGIHTYLLRDVRNVPATLSKAASCIVGVLYWKGKSIGCLDIRQLFVTLNKGFE